MCHPLIRHFIILIIIIIIIIMGSPGLLGVGRGADDPTLGKNFCHKI
jgi:hypothetical protein